MGWSLALLALVLGAVARPVSNSDSGLSNIKNVVVLVQENRSFDTLAGGLKYSSKIDGLVNREYCNPADVKQPDGEKVCAKSTAQNVASDDPNHSIAGGNMQVFGDYHPDANAASKMNGFITEQRTYWKKQDANNLQRAAEVINYHTPDLVPVLNSMAENFVLFDRWFAAVPGPTNPNRAYLTSGTSHGHGKNDDDFLNSALPQKSIFEQLSDKGISWMNYENSTKSDPPFLPDASFYDWTYKSGKNKTNVAPIDQFYKDAKDGKLPKFSWINPECCSYMSMHPASPLNMGENFMKGIYEALRNSPQWKNTLFILTWDEHGGFADHVAPPANVPAGDDLTYTEKAEDGKEYTFKFDRLGVRVPTILMSPWVGKGVVQNKPSEDGNDFTHTSILKFLSELWDLDVLTPRVKWSPSFGNLITNKYRDDTPKKLANAFGY
ncbi:Phosphoesterase [Penicillium alfredii]|uniref:Phosphoesterase n=1 Tax=Penicillium alfredii TaxID=1506179 RepID=A0A9W9ENI1_9EURO|nr:Phosphoesterase [Penicillium alfredii]KAJ5084926.1 Phosphoesterase [Penicillium alfredii]